MKDEFDAIDSSLEVEAEVVPVKKKESTNSHNSKEE